MSKLFIVLFCTFIFLILLSKSPEFLTCERLIVPSMWGWNILAMVRAILWVALLNIIISPPGGVVIMHKQRYIDKINSLLEDTNTYEISYQTTINKNITFFHKLFTKHINKQKTWTSLIEHHPTIQILYSLPKIHKPDIPYNPLSPPLVVPPIK